MRVSLRRLSFCIIAGVLIINIYIGYQFQNDFDLPEVNATEFLVLDWTGKAHIFQEKDSIQCKIFLLDFYDEFRNFIIGDFSHITPDYCQSKFHSLINATLRSQLIKRCSRLSRLIIRWTSDQSRLHQADLVAYHSIDMPSQKLPQLNHQQFSTVYILESEVHSLNGEHWHNIDFPIWYNLEHSYPEPATYFDIQIYLKELFAPVKIPFPKKTTTASIVWISSNW